jgi:translation initiation factor IF-3
MRRNPTGTQDSGAFVVATAWQLVGNRRELDHQSRFGMICGQDQTGSRVGDGTKRLDGDLDRREPSSVEVADRRSGDPVLLSRGDRGGRGFVVASPVVNRASFERGATISRDLRINEMIRIPQVRVIDDEGNQLGVMPTPRALEMAQERGLDLVEIAPMAAPPVARFLDFGQYKYELTKREKENKRRQRSVTFKEVRLSPKIGSGDFATKMHRAVEFLEDGDRIKVTVRFRGRELSHPELGRVLLERFAKQVEEHGVIERAPVLEGKSMFIVLASTHKPKVAEAPQRSARPDEELPGPSNGPAPASAGSPPAPPAPADGPDAAAAPTPRPKQPTTPTNGAAAPQTASPSGD